MTSTAQTVPMKKILKLKLGDLVPASATLIKIESVVERIKPPEGGSRLVKVEYCYYEVIL